LSNLALKGQIPIKYSDFREPIPEGFAFQQVRHHLQRFSTASHLWWIGCGAGCEL